MARGRPQNPNSKTRLLAIARAERKVERLARKAAAIQEKETIKQSAKNARMVANEEKARRMFSMYQQGVTLEFIGKQFGITRERVRQYIAATGHCGKDGGVRKRAEEKRATRRRTQDAKLTLKYGLDADVVRQLISDGVTRAYKEQERNSRQRGVDWRISFDQWFSIWQASGKLHLRGRGKGKYVMSRIKDDGGYEIGNVHIQLATENSKEAVAKWNGKTKENRGVFCVYPGRELAWLATANRKRLGFFKTEQEAVEARERYFIESGELPNCLGSGRGWTFNKRLKTPYVMRAPGITKSFATADEARAAYLEATKSIAEFRKAATA